MTNLELLQEIEAWLCFNLTPSKQDLIDLKKSLKDHIESKLNQE